MPDGHCREEGRVEYRLPLTSREEAELAQLLKLRRGFRRSEQNVLASPGGLVQMTWYDDEMPSNLPPDAATVVKM
jgi:hypothetical protein